MVELVDKFDQIGYRTKNGGLSTARINKRLLRLLSLRLGGTKRARSLLRDVAEAASQKGAENISNQISYAALMRIADRDTSEKIMESSLSPIHHQEIYINDKPVAIEYHFLILMSHLYNGMSRGIISISNALKGKDNITKDDVINQILSKI